MTAATLRREPCGRRGLTSLELLIAVAITAMIGVALAGLLKAATMGVTQRRDNRLNTTRSGVFQKRLSAYVTPARAVLSAGSDNIVLWANDPNGSETVNATEIRWLFFFASPEPVARPDGGRIEVHYVELPASLTEIQRRLLDLEYAQIVPDWMDVYDAYRAQSYLKSIVLVDGLRAAAMTHDNATDRVDVELRFAVGPTSTETWTVSATMQGADP